MVHAHEVWSWWWLMISQWLPPGLIMADHDGQWWTRQQGRTTTNSNNNHNHDPQMMAWSADCVYGQRLPLETSTCWTSLNNQAKITCFQLAYPNSRSPRFTKREMQGLPWTLTLHHSEAHRRSPLSKTVRICQCGNFLMRVMVVLWFFSGENCAVFHVLFASDFVLGNSLEFFIVWLCAFDCVHLHVWWRVFPLVK